jgi:hypothetical protein
MLSTGTRLPGTTVSVVVPVAPCGSVTVSRAVSGAVAVPPYVWTIRAPAPLVPSPKSQA